MALTKTAPASAPAASQQPRSFFGRPLVLVAAALVLLTAFGWAFLIALGASGAAVLERRSEGRVAIMLAIVATLLLGFTLASGLIFSEQSLPPLPTSLVNLGLAAVLTSVFKWVYEKRLEKRRKKRGFFARLADLFRV